MHSILTQPALPAVLPESNGQSVPEGQGGKTSALKTRRPLNETGFRRRYS